MSYAYEAAMWCDDCATKIKAKLDAEGIEDDGTTDCYPQWTPDDAESDSPEHCDECHGFLENTLTGDGYAYVQEAIEDDIANGRWDSVALTEWLPFYGSDLEPLPLEDVVKLLRPKEAP